MLEAEFPARSGTRPGPTADYLYDARKMIDLPGRSARQAHFINRFVGLRGALLFEPFDPEDGMNCTTTRPAGARQPHLEAIWRR
jgi:hypothetical protein